MKFQWLRLTARLLAAPQPHIKRAFAAMADMGIVEADDKRAEFRQGEPQWHLPLEHAALVRGIAMGGALAFAGDDERSLGAIGLSAMQEAQQRGVRLVLRHAVQIDARVDRLAAARHALLEPPAERRQRRCGRRRFPRCDGTGSRRRWRWSAGDGWCCGRLRAWLGTRLRRLRRPQGRDRAGEAGPQSLFLVAQLTPPAHGFGRGFRFGEMAAAAAAADFGAGSTAGFGSGSGTSTAVGSSMVLTLAVNALGRSGGSGVSRPASTGSSARGSSMKKLPGLLIRPAMRAASSPAPK